ncbi:hypothetical protein [Pseudomonas sp. CC120222-01a]|uniref:hypothetical protein n=1 Tax=Pseudomonas sp. CC120222-01a TaxID=1378075 RepID=UPI000D86AFDA|nr:hypothetical protein [Pseudomonas sp. CC120222-01a]PVZ42731.1 hypothetical protein N430_01344 [Pseudomonas sp. CC120222-01a]
MAVEQPAQWIQRSSFLGKLYLLDQSKRIPLSLTTAGLFDFAANDWLQAGGASDSPTMLFHYHSETPDRINVKIALFDKRVATLDISRNNYLGFYANQDKQAVFKLQPLEWNKDTLKCHWRDQQDNHVRRIAGAPTNLAETAYLSVAAGTQHEFLVVRTN